MFRKEADSASKKSNLTPEIIPTPEKPLKNSNDTTTTLQNENIKLQLHPAPVTDSNANALRNIVQLSASLNIDQNKKYIAKLTANTFKKDFIYYPIVFEKQITKETIGIARHMRYALNYAIPNDKNDPSQMQAAELELIELSPDFKFEKCHSIDIQLKIIHTVDPLKFAQVVNTEELTTTIKKSIDQYPLSLSQTLLFNYEQRDEKAFIEVTVNKINGFGKYPSQSLTPFFNIDSDTQFTYSIAPSAAGKIILPAEDSTKIPLDFVEDGIGGHKNELKRLLREGFYTRALGAENADAYGVHHTKGVLLYGPPGTGKTLIARVIAKKFKNSNVKIVSGPELKNKFVGSSQEKLRAVFADAIADWKSKRDQSPLHVIIFDEIDSLAPRRGAYSGGTAVEDDMTTTLLTMLDGVDSPGNILVMGTTNRKEALDEALLRENRMEVHLKIGLPDEAAG